MSNLHKILIILAHAVIGWALCFATIGVGLAVTTLQPTLIAHAIGAPIYFIAVSAVYFTRFAHTAPLSTALTFTGFVVVVDFFLVALVILRSLDMFTSPLGTWIPFTLIFASTWLTGLVVTRHHATHLSNPPGIAREPARRESPRVHRRVRARRHRLGNG